MHAWQADCLIRSRLGKSWDEVIGRRYVASIDVGGRHEIEVVGVRFTPFDDNDGAMHVKVVSKTFPFKSILFWSHYHLNEPGGHFEVPCPFRNAEDYDDCSCCGVHLVKIRQL